MRNFSKLHHQILLMLCSILIIVSIITSLYVPWVHSIVRIQKSQYELNYPLDVGLLRCFSDVCEDYDDIFRLIRDIHRHYRQRHEDEAPQLPPYPSHSPSSLISHDSNYLITSGHPTLAPTLFVEIISPDLENTQNITTSGISIPPIHLPEKPPKIPQLPPMPPLPAPVLPPTIGDLADHSDTHDDISKIASNQLIDRATLKRIIRPFEMASRMTVVFLLLAVILALIVISLIVYDALLLPFYYWYYPAGKENVQYQFATNENNQTFYYQLVSNELPSNINTNRSRLEPSGIELSLQSKERSFEKNCSKVSLSPSSKLLFTSPPFHDVINNNSILATLKKGNTNTFSNHNNVNINNINSSYNSIDNVNIKNNISNANNTLSRVLIDNYRPKGKYSPTRVCTPPELSFVDDEERIQSSTSFLSPENNKRTVKDLVQFYESPMKTPMPKIHEEAPQSLNKMHCNPVYNKSHEKMNHDGFSSPHKNDSNDKKVTTTSSVLTCVTSSVSALRREEAEDAEEELIVSDSENNSYMNASSTCGDRDEDEECDINSNNVDEKAEEKRKSEAVYWRHMGYYRALNITLVMALFSLFFALVAYLSFTTVSMTLRGSYYREGVWIMTYMIMIGLFAALRIAIVMLDDQQAYCEKVHGQRDIAKWKMQKNSRKNKHRKPNNLTGNRDRDLEQGRK